MPETDEEKKAREAKEDKDYFKTLLSEVLPEWMKETGLSLPNKETKTADLPRTLETFLHDQVAEMKGANKSLNEKLEAALDLMTPEQRTLLKSPKKEGENVLPTKKEPPEKLPENKPRGGFLTSRRRSPPTP